MIINEVDNLCLLVEAEKISAKEDTSEWNLEINDKLVQADGHVRATNEWLEENKRKRKTIEGEEKLQFEVKLLETKLKLQAEHDTAKQSRSAAQTGGTMIGMQAKLVKLVISKFEGAYTDWPRFWGQFTENIDKTTVAPITKFSCLRESLGAKVKHCRNVALYTGRV